MWLTVQRKLVMLGDELCVLIHTLRKVFLKPALYFCRTFKASAGGRAYGYSHLLPLCNPFLQPIRASATTADPPSGEPISWKHPPPPPPLPCMPSLLSEQSMPHSISWEETNRKKSAHTHTTERIGWLESLKGGAWKYIEEEEKWEVRRVCSMPDRFCIQDTLEVCEWEEKNGKREDSEEKRQGREPVRKQGCKFVDGFFICVCVTESGER